ncbi:MAG: hypothetical protein M3R59_04185 [Verrucomicrobiota bacterium]|nr:hypothetical protein [Verrucomicrobiota bacterium]
MSKRVVCGIFFFSISALGAFAQDNAFDRAQAFRGFTNDDGVVDGHAVATDNDLDMGDQSILQSQGRYRPFTASAGVPFYYTSNAGLTRSHAASDFVVAPFVHLEYQPQLTSTLFAFASLDDQALFYARNDGYDINSFDARLGLNYYVPSAGNLVLRAQYEYARVTNIGDVAAPIYQHDLLLNAELPFTINARQQLALGVYGRVSFYTNPGRARRHEVSPYIDYRIGLTHRLVLDLYGEGGLREYAYSNRRDFEGLGAVALEYRLSRCATASLRGSYALNRSNQSFYDYNVGNLGGLLQFSVKF